MYIICAFRFPFLCSSFFRSSLSTEIYQNHHFLEDLVTSAACIAQCILPSSCRVPNCCCPLKVHCLWRHLWSSIHYLQSILSQNCHNSLLSCTFFPQVSKFSVYITVFLKNKHIQYATLLRINFADTPCRAKIVLPTGITLNFPMS